MTGNGIAPDKQDRLLTFTAQIVAAYASKTDLTTPELVAIIQRVAAALGQLGQPTLQAMPIKSSPAVPIKKSVSADFIVCLEDGKKLKMLKRHIMGKYGLTPAEYRLKWKLPRDYPMVAPNYAATRSRLAKKSGLGRPKLFQAGADQVTPKKGRGRPRKVPNPASAPG